MKNPFVIAVLVLLALWYLLGFVMTWGFTGKLGDALLWPALKLRGYLNPKPAIASGTEYGSLTNADGLPAGSMSLS